MMSRTIECSACGLTSSDLLDYVNPEWVFEYDERSNTHHCLTCPALSDDDEWIAEMRFKARDYEGWSRL